jgi:hypothetical protein
MSKNEPNRDLRGDRAPKVIGNVFKEIFYSAGVVVGGALISAVLVAIEGRGLKHH